MMPEDYSRIFKSTKSANYSAENVSNGIGGDIPARESWRANGTASLGDPWNKTSSDGVTRPSIDDLHQGVIFAAVHHVIFSVGFIVLCALLAATAYARTRRRWRMRELLEAAKAGSRDVPTEHSPLAAFRYVG